MLRAVYSQFNSRGCRGLRANVEPMCPPLTLHTETHPAGRFMALHPEQWDYSAAGVPSALTEDMAAHQEARAAQKKARHREKEKVRQHPLTFYVNNWRLKQPSFETSLNLVLSQV